MKLGEYDASRSRRRFLQEAAVSLFAGSTYLAPKLGIPQAVLNYAKAWEARQLHEAARIWGSDEIKIAELLNPYPAFLNSPLLVSRSPLNFSSPHEGQVYSHLAMGDSNMRGPGGDNPEQAPPQLVVNEWKVKGGIWRPVRNYAKNGKRTDEIHREQLYLPIQEGVLHGATDVTFWADIGGNDIGRVIENVHDVEKLQAIGKQPIKSDTPEYLSRVVQLAERFKGDLTGFLYDFGETYKRFPSVRNLILFTIPNYGKVSHVTSPSIDGQVYNLDIQNGFVSYMAQNISIIFDNKMLEALEEFKKKYPQFSVGAVNTFDMRKADFSEDQHYSLSGVKKIATQVLDHTSFTA